MKKYKFDDSVNGHFNMRMKIKQAKVTTLD